MAFSTPSVGPAREEYKVAIICAVTDEASAVEKLLDSQFAPPGASPSDSNSYTTGVLYGHNVVVVHGYRMGTTASATLVRGIQSTYPEVQLVLLTGICGAVPENNKNPVYLGDLIISTGVLEYDFGREETSGFTPKTKSEDRQGPPGLKVRSLYKKLQSDQNMATFKDSLGKWLQSAIRPGAEHPGSASDRLFPADYVHKHRLSKCPKCEDNQTCDEARDLDCKEAGCEPTKVVPGRRNETTLARPPPEVHFGKFGSANSVMRSAAVRDKLAKDENVIAFEMEGAGLWDAFQCVVIIKAVCDYSDSHKNKIWRRYAALVGAAGAKAFLQQWPHSDPTPNRNSSDGPPQPPPTKKRSPRKKSSRKSQGTVFNNYRSKIGSQMRDQTINGDAIINFGSKHWDNSSSDESSSDESSSDDPS